MRQMQPDAGRAGLLFLSGHVSAAQARELTGASLLALVGSLPALLAVAQIALALAEWAQALL